MGIYCEIGKLPLIISRRRRPVTTWTSLVCTEILNIAYFRKFSLDVVSAASRRTEREHARDSLHPVAFSSEHDDETVF